MKGSDESSSSSGSDAGDGDGGKVFGKEKAGNGLVLATTVPYIVDWELTLSDDSTDTDLGLCLITTSEKVTDRDELWGLPCDVEGEGSDGESALLLASAPDVSIAG